ncbi:PREDICTED: protein spaetzle isoform X2 [Ceratosolen solmsi marchali]|nr:PREDICTED: protein spaetzle isoform X2 [Ceratosolen solmsi marchali]XP_011505472.1 PREDICTED: protein spaetzle isoform X2 [Ceratosolen solmsi marchali]
MGYSRRWFDTHMMTNISHAAVPQRIDMSESISIRRKILSKGNYDITNRKDGKIIFPSDDTDNQPQRYVPEPSPICENSTFCENILNYPNDLVETALRMNKNLKFLPGVDLVPDVVHRVNVPPEDYPLCDSKEMVIYPKAAKNQDKEWIFVINQGDFIQSVRVETCVKENSVCNLVDDFAEGYKTTCKQKYIYRQLMAISSTGQIKPEVFKFPVSCCCHVKFTGNPLIRMGLGVNKKKEFSALNSRKK